MSVAHSPHSHAHGHAHSNGHAHAGPKLYWIFAVILCVITFFEWIIFKERVSWGLSNSTLVVGLLVLSVVKFVMVCGWYMHLRFDNKMLTWIFVFAALLAIGVFVILRLSLPHTTEGKQKAAEQIPADPHQ